MTVYIDNTDYELLISGETCNVICYKSYKRLLRNHDNLGKKAFPKPHWKLSITVMKASENKRNQIKMEF